MIDHQIRYRRSSTVLWRRCLRSVLLLPKGAELPLNLTGSGVDMWHLLEQPQTVQTTARQLAEQFGVDVSEVTPSVAAALEQLVEARAVEPGSS